MKAYVAALSPSQLERLRRALIAGHGARSMLCLGGASLPPSIGVLTQSCLALAETWTRTGMDLALSGWAGAVAAACNAEQRAHVDALLAATTTLGQRVTATTTTTIKA